MDVVMLIINKIQGIFFAVIKLFHSQNINQMRMIYLLLKEERKKESWLNQIKIMIVLYCPNSIRVLCKIINTVMYWSDKERNIRQGIVDKDVLVVKCSVLVCGNHIMADNIKKEIVKRWLNKIQEAVQARSEMAQYHALSLPYHIKSHDKLAIIKLVF